MKKNNFVLRVSISPKFAREARFEIHCHPSCSPDLAPGDYVLSESHIGSHRGRLLLNNVFLSWATIIGEKLEYLCEP